MKMKRVMMSAVLGVILFVGVQGVCSASLRDDYRDLVVKRQALENRRTEYVVAIKELKAAQRKLTFDLYQCVIKKRQGKWTAMLKEAQAVSDELEKERIRLTRLRIELDKVRKALEEERAEIEKTHTLKTEGSAYETAFRGYMEKLASEYFEPIETRLFTGYSQFSSDIERLNTFLETAVQDCNAGSGPNP